MNEIKWLKLDVNLFNNEKIILISTMHKKNFDFIITTWLRLLCLAGSQNNSGVFIQPNGKPYTIDTFATLFNIRKDKANTAFSVLIEFEMLELNDGFYSIKNWNSYQDFGVLERKRAYDRNYQKQRYQAKKQAKELLNDDNESKTNTDESDEILLREKYDNRILDIDKNKNKNKINNNININNKCLLNFEKSFKNSWCKNNCKYYNDCNLKEQINYNNKKVAPVPDWFIEQQQKEDK